MVRGLCIGFLLGAIAGSLVSRWLAPARGTNSPDAQVTARAETHASTPVESGEVARLETALAAARAEIEDWKGRAARDRQARPAGETMDPAGRWSEFAGRFAEILKAHGSMPDRDSPEGRELGLDMAALVRELARSKGLTPAELMANPDGWPTLVRSALALLEPPLGAVEVQVLDEELRKQRESWAEFQSRRGQMVGVEISREAALLSDRFKGALRPALPGHANELLAQLQNVWSFQGSDSGPETYSWSTGDPEDVRGDLRADWSASLFLTEQQTLALDPILDTFLRDSEALTGQRVAASLSGDANAQAAAQARCVELMIEAQRRMLQQLNLTPEQVAVLKAWNRVDEVLIRANR